MYEDNGFYDVSLDMYNGVEPIRTFKNQEEAENFVLRLAAYLKESDEGVIVDCDKL